MKFAWIQAEKAHYPVRQALSVAGRDPERVLRVVHAAGVGARDA